MEVQVDPGSKTNCIPSSHFRCLFPQLCREYDNPRENALEPTCPNKAPKIKRQVTSVSKKAKKPSDHNNNNFLSGLHHPPKVKYFIAAPQHPPKKYSQMVMVKQQQDVSPTSQPHSQRRCCRGKPVHREIDGHLDHQPVKSFISGWQNGAMRVQSGQSMSPYSTTTPSQSTIKSLSNNCYCSSNSRTTTPPKVKYRDFCQHVSTTSHKKTRKLTTSTLRATSRVTKTP